MIQQQQHPKTAVCRHNNTSFTALPIDNGTIDTDATVTVFLYSDDASDKEGVSTSLF
jgi:hypothetical protein